MTENWRIVRMPRRDVIVISENTFKISEKICAEFNVEIFFRCLYYAIELWLWFICFTKINTSKLVLINSAKQNVKSMVAFLIKSNRVVGVAKYT